VPYSSSAISAASASLVGFEQPAAIRLNSAACASYSVSALCEEAIGCLVWTEEVEGGLVMLREEERKAARQGLAKPQRTKLRQWLEPGGALSSTEGLRLRTSTTG
jgi:hypothetical protein